MSHETIMLEDRCADRFVKIGYWTERIDYEHIREGIIQQRDLLQNNGYSCRWNSGLDLDLLWSLDRAVLLEGGYIYTRGGLITTEFEDDRRRYKISVYPDNWKAIVEGRDMIRCPEWDGVKQKIKELGRLTGVEFKLKQLSDPY